MKKLSLGGGGLKDFLAQHVEKMLLALAAMITLTLVWSGFANRQAIETTKDPSRLQQEITQATSHIDDFSWEKDFKETRDREQNFLARAQETLKAMDVAAYQMPQLVKPPYYPPRTMRTDPELFPPIELQALAGYGALSLAVQRGSGEVFQEQPNRFAGSPLGDRFGGQEEEDDGTRPITSGILGGRRGREGLGGFSSGKREGRHFVAVTGLIPLRKQVEAYNEALANSADYLPSRDFPNVLTWKLERAEVRGSDDQRLRWREVATLKKAGTEFMEWARSNTSQFIDPRAVGMKVTSPVPPLESHNLEQLMRHDKIEPYTDLRFSAQRGRFAGPEGRQDQEPDELAGNVAWGGAGGRGGMPMMSGEFGGASAMAGSPYGPGPMMGGEEGMQGGEFGMRGEYGPGSEYGPGMGGPDRGGAMMGNPYMGGSGEFGGGRGMSRTGGVIEPENVPEYNMFRYVDFRVTPGKMYRYRLKLTLVDPNSPSKNFPQPATRSLDPGVANRLAECQLPEKLAEKYGVKHQFWRDTEWSAPSNPVYVTSGHRLLAGEATAISPVKVKGGMFAKPGDEPSAKIMALEFDKPMATEVPCELTVHRGTIANFVETVEAPLWDEGILKKIENRPFRLNTVVLDIEGGEPLDVGDWKAPTELLVWNEAGEMDVVNELDSLAEYDRFIFPPEDEAGPGRGSDVPGGFEGEMGEGALMDSSVEGGRRGGSRRGSRTPRGRGGRGGGER